MYKYTEISFPAFGLVIDPQRSLSIGPLTIHSHRLGTAAGGDLCLAAVP